MTSSYTTNKSIEKPGYNDYASSPTGWSAPINTDWDIIDAAFGGVTVKNPTGVSGTVALVASEYQKLTIVFGTSITGVATLTANIIYTIPAGVGGSWIVYNNTTGAFTITIQQVSGGGTSIVVPQGSRSIIFSDGTNFAALSGTGSDTQVLYNSSGAITGSANLTFNGTTLTGNALTATNAVTAGTSIVAGTTITAGTTASDSLGNLRTVPPNAQTGAYVLALTDSGKYVSITTGGVTVPPSSTVAFVAGQTISIYNNSSADQIITQGTGVTMKLAGTATTGNRTLAQYGLCTILCTGTNAFVVTGAGVS